MMNVEIVAPGHRRYLQRSCLDLEREARDDARVKLLKQFCWDRQFFTKNQLRVATGMGPDEAESVIAIGLRIKFIVPHARSKSSYKVTTK